MAYTRKRKALKRGGGNNNNKAPKKKVAVTIIRGSSPLSAVLTSANNSRGLQTASLIKAPQLAEVTKAPNLSNSESTASLVSASRLSTPLSSQRHSVSSVSSSESGFSSDLPQKPMSIRISIPPGLPLVKPVAVAPSKREPPPPYTPGAGLRATRGNPPKSTKGGRRKNKNKYKTKKNR